MEMILFERDGKKLLGHFDKNGYFFVLDRTNEELQHVTPFVDRIDWGVITRDGKVTPRKYPDKEGEPVHFAARRREGMDARGLQPEDRDVLRPGRRRGRHRHPPSPRVQGGHAVLGRCRRGWRASTTWPVQSARSTPTVRRSGAGASTTRWPRQCSPPQATWCSQARRPANSSRSTPTPARNCGVPVW